MGPLLSADSTGVSDFPWGAGWPVMQHHHAWLTIMAASGCIGDCALEEACLGAAEGGLGEELGYKLKLCVCLLKSKMKYFGHRPPTHALLSFQDF